MFAKSVRRVVFSFLFVASGFAHAMPLQNGGELNGSITAPNQSVQYTFQGDVGDTVYISVGDTTVPASSFGPEIEIYDSSGNLINSDWGGVAASVDFTIASANQYTALVKDRYSTYSGTFSISYARIPDADEGGTLDNPTVYNDSIDFGDMDTYTLTASLGHTIHLSAGDLTGNSFAPHLYLFDPSGALVADDWGGVGASIRYQTTVGGKFTVLIKDHYDTYTADYALHYARAPGAYEHGIFVNDEYVSEAITTGDIDTYRAVLTAGQVLHVNVADKSGTSFAPHIYVYDSSGELKANDWNGVGAGVIYDVLTSGAHTVVVEDHYSTYEGEYDLYMARAPGANEGGALSNSDEIIGSIDLADIDTYSLYCDANATVQLDVNDLSGSSFAPHLYLYDFTGDLIADNWSGSSLQLSETIPVTGNYTVVLQDHYESYSGNYQLNATLLGCSGGGGPTMCDGQAVTINIGAGQLPTRFNDVIVGTSGPDTINAGGGNDIVCGLGGDDTIYGSAGNDRLFGGAGEDNLFGGSGSDYLDGDADIDNLYGQGGSDTILGGGGFDYIVGGSGNDDIETGDGGATVIAGGNNDVIEGSPDRDVIYGNSGLDTIHGRAGDDELSGGNGADYVFGGSGDDIINGQGARDRLYGESGDDLIRGGIGDDLIDGGSDTDDCNGQGGTDTELNCEI